MKSKISFKSAILLVAIITGCTDKSHFDKALQTISIEDLARQVSIVAADSFMGRQPFTSGEEITINYLAAELERMNFSPAFNGSWFQKVPMTEILTTADGPAIIRTGNKTMKLFAPDDLALTSPSVAENITVHESEIVFAGFGIVAPEYGWNDYQNLDVKGKTVVVLINDPGLYTGNPDLFKGREMTYYGRWTYKFEEAARQGADGILIIHESEGAGYEYTIPRKSSVTPRLQIDNEGNNSSKCSFTGWLSAKAADDFFSSLGMSVETLRSEACVMGYKGFSTGASLDLNLTNRIKKSNSSNVAGILKGRSRPDEVIVYTAHWDHFGVGEMENGDSIYNGAVDNGTSIAWAFEIAEAFSSLPMKPERSILILFPTAEEQGLIGSSYYSANPVTDPENCVACFNNDLMLPIGRMKDIMITGFGQSELDSIVELVAKKQDRYIMADPNPHTGMYFRSDHFPFAASGIPSMFARGNCDNREMGSEWTALMEKEYINNRYHRPADNYDPLTWDFHGIKEDAMLMFEVGFILANSSYFPKWNEKSEFSRLRKRDHQ